MIKTMSGNLGWKLFAVTKLSTVNDNDAEEIFAESYVLSEGALFFECPIFKKMPNFHYKRPDVLAWAAEGREGRSQEARRASS